MVKRLKQIETGANGWQGCAWLTERLFPTRNAKPEVQISLNTASGQGNQAHVITISLEEAERLEPENQHRSAKRLASCLRNTSATAMALARLPGNSSN